jgi:NTE family protein
MDRNTMAGRALVLAGGGVTGIAWELGILTGLHDRGLDVRDADLIVGTSAGSSVGAQITSGVDLETLFAAQLVPPEQSAERSVAFDPSAMAKAVQGLMASGPWDPRTLRARIGSYALGASAVPEAERRAIIASRLPAAEWPRDRALLIVAVDVQTGEERIFDRDSGVFLVDAVAASCAVPGVWPPVTIAGHRYMDGGMRSTTNADLARGYGRVLILSPLGMDSLGPFGNPQEEVAQLEQAGSTVRVVTPDATATQALGPNPLDPARREAAARAGRTQGETLAASLQAFWLAG